MRDLNICVTRSNELTPIYRTAISNLPPSMAAWRAAYRGALNCLLSILFSLSSFFFSFRSLLCYSALYKLPLLIQK